MRSSSPLVAVACLVAACAGARARSTSTSPSVAEAFVTSNVARADYVGSEACKPCHAELFARWQKSPMHAMTRSADHAEIRAPFDGRSLHFKGDAATLETVDGARYLRLTSKFGDGLFRVTKVIGGHHREDFAGVAVSAERADAVVGDPHRELVLPVSYMIATGELRYKGYSVMATERPGMKPGPVWSQTCIFCHNTEPYLTTILGALETKRSRGYQGVVIDALLPNDRRQRFVVDDEPALRRAIGLETSLLGASLDLDRPLADLLADAKTATRTRFDETKLVEIGIGCEACHGGGREHVEDPHKHPSLAPTSPMLHPAGFGLGTGHD
ncbi:MAG: hypothetical protein ACHREM_25975, partial [Polyangiales bacterium]